MRADLQVWKDFEGHCLDAKAISALARVVELQNIHLRFLASHVYVDPETAWKKLDSLPKERLARLLLQIWHPIVELEQLTAGALEEARGYWEQLLNWSERWKKYDPGPLSRGGDLTEEELEHLGILSWEEFSSRTEVLWTQLKTSVGTRGRIEYSKFVRDKDFPSTIRRAQYLSFLVSYGYADLQEEKGNVFIVPQEEPRRRTPENTTSFPVELTLRMWEDWEKTA